MQNTTVDVAGSRQPVPRVDFSPGPEYADDRRCFGICSSIARSPGGRLWCGFSSGGAGEGNLNYGVVVTSDDDGRTWTAPRIVLDTDGDGPIRSDHVVTWVSPADELWIMWSQYPEGLCGAHSSLWAIVSRDPDAADPAFSAPRKLADQQNLLNKPTVLSDGLWVFPTGCWQENSDTPSRPLLSTDAGRSFRLGGPLVTDTPTDFDEYMVVERWDGVLTFLNRHKGSFLTAYSTDRCQTWSPQHANGLVHTNSRFVFTKLASGAWLLVKHGGLDWVSTAKEGHMDNYGRSHLTAFLSHDEGSTWTGGLVIEERDCSYPDAFVAPDGLVYVSYERSRWSQAEILMATFREEDVAHGACCSPDARLRVLVNKAGIPASA